GNGDVTKESEAHITFNGCKNSTCEQLCQQKHGQAYCTVEGLCHWDGDVTKESEAHITFNGCKNSTCEQLCQQKHGQAYCTVEGLCHCISHPHPPSSPIR
ncbi:unnamed protein product, partial [Sphenostylis stenocarpa]